MKMRYNKIGMLSIICFVGLFSCNKNDSVDLIAPSFKALELSCGADFEVPVLTNSWNIESVKYLPSNELMLDMDGNPLALVGNGTIEASNGWLTLTRDKDDKFVMGLKENFDKSNERKFAICINDGSHRDYITVHQRAGSEYELVKSEYKEIEEHREIWVSDENCSELTLYNNTSEAVWEPTGSIFERVVNSSDFESDDYGAFGWTLGKDIKISVPELMINDTIRWNNTWCAYTKGITTTPYIKDILNGNKILVQPYSTIHLRGKITYCKRVCNYTFTIQNMGSGTQFEISGVWKQIVPISTYTISGR